MPEAWRPSELGEHLREPIRNGYSPNCPTEPTGKWVLSLAAVTHGGFNAEGVKPAPPNDPRVDAASLEPGDVVVSRSNTRERVGLAGVYRGIPTNCSYPDLLMRVRPTPELSAEFLCYALLSPNGRAYFQKTARGTSGSMVKIDRSLLERFPIALPAVGEQRKIAAILSSVDDAIEATQAVIDQLQVVKKAMMAELLTRGLPGRHTQFKMTEIGEIPSTWDVETLGQLTSESAFGPRFPAGRYSVSGAIGTVRTTDLTEDWEIDYTTIPRADLNREEVESHLLRDGDLLVSRSGTCGVVAVFRKQSIEMIPAAFLIRFRLRPGVRPEFIRLAMIAPDAQRRIQGMAAGGVQKNLSGTNLLTLRLPKPPPEEQDEIASSIELFDNRLRAEREALRQLSTLKSALMSVLLTGEVRVKSDDEAPA